jgi:hypothetical protein
VKHWLYCEGSPELLFTENETNRQRLFNAPESGLRKKDAINDYIVDGNKQAVAAQRTGTKAAAHYAIEIAAGASVNVRLRLTNLSVAQPSAAFTNFDSIIAIRKQEADDFYATIIPKSLSADAKNVMRQGFAGLLWSKQFYHYVVKEWLAGDPGNPPPPPERASGRNHDWLHLYNADVISMPDKWRKSNSCSCSANGTCIPTASSLPTNGRSEM